MDEVTLGGGCFWCIEAVFNRVDGVGEVVSGYAGGHAKDPTYREVCAGGTGHAEVVQLTYDPNVITFEDILELFFEVHDPTQKNRQGPDVGSQYRSIILYHDETQKKTAERIIEELNALDEYDRPVVTEVEPLDKFFRAEEKHQDYFEKHPEQPYCQVNIPPKIQKAKKLKPGTLNARES